MSARVYVVTREVRQFQASIFLEDRVLKGTETEVLAVFTSLAEAKAWIRNISAFLKTNDPESYCDSLDQDQDLCVTGLAPMHEIKYKVEQFELNQYAKKQTAWRKRLQAMGFKPEAFSLPR